MRVTSQGGPDYSAHWVSTRLQKAKNQSSDGKAWHAMTIKYSEGCVFLVPLRYGGYARGVAARTSDANVVVFGYFYGPRIESTIGVRVDDLAPDNAIFRVRFGDRCLVNGEWPICGTVPNWNRAQWRMPDFARLQELTRTAWIIRYSDDDPSQVTLEQPTDFSSQLDRDTVSGSGAVETRLSKLISALKD